jgi:hypothetical protein
VDCSWDAPDKQRLQVTTAKFTKEELKDMDFKAYLADDTGSSLDEEETEIPQEGKSDTKGLPESTDGNALLNSRFTHA